MLSKIALTLLVLISVSRAENKPHQVVMKSISYEPKSLTIPVGDSVEWTNESYTDHSATSEDNRTFDTGMIQPKHHSKAFVFSKPGIYPYHCTMHGQTMSGTIEAK